MIKSNGLMSPQNYLEKVTGKCFVMRGNDDALIIKKVLKQEGVTAKSFAFKQIDKAITQGVDVVLVDCYTDNGNKLVWFEIPAKKGKVAQ